MDTNKKSIISGMFWTFSERMAAQLVSVIVSIILARLLTPDEYGTVALITVFIAIANVFVTNGFGSALIQKENADNVDFSTAFYFSIIFGICLYGVLFAVAPYIADFYETPILIPLFRILAIKVPISSINSVQQAYVSRKMIFEKFFYATLMGTVISACVGILMAYNGYGVWSLVVQELINTVIGTIALWVTVKWRPNRVFVLKRLKELFSYGWKILIQGLFVSIYSNLRSLLLGKVYSTQDLAYYNKGSGYPNLIVTNVDTAMGKTLFPAMAKEQADYSRIKALARRSTQLSSYIMCPLLIGFMACANSFTSMLLGDKWLPMVPYLRIICIVLLIRPAQSSIQQAIKATGRSDTFLKMDIPVRSFSIAVLLVSIKMGVLYVAISEIFGEYFCLVIYARASRKIIDYSLIDVISDLLPNVFIASIMGIAVWFIGSHLGMGPFVTVSLQVTMGAVLYLAFSILTKNKNFKYLWNNVAELIRK